MNFEPRKELIPYLRLARASSDRLQMKQRDQALVMAGVCAAMLKIDRIAHFCRSLILQNNHGHMLKRYESFGDAIVDDNFVTYLRRLREKLDPEKARELLKQYAYVDAVRKSDYTDNESYAAAVLNVDVKWLRDHCG